MNNEQREAHYLRDRSKLTSSQRRRMKHKTISNRPTLRAAHRDVRRDNTRLHARIRSVFRRARETGAIR